MRNRRFSLLLSALLLCGCGDNSSETSFTISQATPPPESTKEPEELHTVELHIESALENGTSAVYHYLNGNSIRIDERAFSESSSEHHFSFRAPISVEASTLLIHVTQSGNIDQGNQEYVCFVDLDLTSFRHEASTQCSYWQTVAFYLSASHVSRGDEPTFSRIGERLSLWRAIVQVEDDDLHGFYTSLFGTVQNALSDLGYDRFDLTRHSLRPVMETIVQTFLDQFQRDGSIYASDLIRIINDVTDNALPIARLTGFDRSYDKYAYFAPVTLRNTGGSFTRRTTRIELLSIESELRRFLRHGMPLEMSDYRTQVVQSINYRVVDEKGLLTWDPIPHMYGYNIYLNTIHQGFNRLPSHQFNMTSSGTVTIRAVGYAGEFDGVSHEIQPFPQNRKSDS